MGDREKQQRVYDKFRSYVHSRMRGRNSKLTVTNFSNVPRAGPTHIKIELENCFHADGTLFELVKQFHPDASLVVTEKILEKGSRYIANIPWRIKKQPSRTSDDDDMYKPTEPNVIVPMLWSMALMATVVAASFTTTYPQWAALMGW